MWHFKAYYYSYELDKRTRVLITVDISQLESINPAVIWQAAISRAYWSMPDGYDELVKIKRAFN